MSERVDLAAIRDAHRPFDVHGVLWCHCCDVPAPCDASNLLDECERLRAKVELVEAACDRWSESAKSIPLTGYEMWQAVRAALGESA